MCFQIYIMLFVLCAANIYVSGEAWFRCRLMTKLQFIFSLCYLKMF